LGAAFASLDAALDGLTSLQHGGRCWTGRPGAASRPGNLIRRSCSSSTSQRCSAAGPRAHPPRPSLRRILAVILTPGRRTQSARSCFRVPRAPGLPAVRAEGTGLPAQPRGPRSEFPSTSSSLVLCLGLPGDSAHALVRRGAFLRSGTAGGAHTAQLPAHQESREHGRGPPRCVHAEPGGGRGGRLRSGRPVPQLVCFSGHRPPQGVCCSNYSHRRG